jgi:hypothetical protein
MPGMSRRLNRRSYLRNVLPPRQREPKARGQTTYQVKDIYLNNPISTLFTHCAEPLSVLIDSYRERMSEGFRVIFLICNGALASKPNCTEFSTGEGHPN